MPPSPGPEWGLSQAVNARPAGTIVLIPLPEQVGPTPSPLPARPGGFLLALPGRVKQKAWNGGLSKRGKEKGGPSLSLSHAPHCFKGSPFPSPREKAFYLQNKSPLDMKRGGLWPGKAKRSPQPVLDQCILIAALLRRTTKRDRAPRGGRAGEGGRGGAHSGGGGLGKQTPNPESRPQQPLWVGPHCLWVRSHAPPRPTF